MKIGERILIISTKELNSEKFGRLYQCSLEYKKNINKKWRTLKIKDVIIHSDTLVIEQDKYYRVLDFEMYSWIRTQKDGKPFLNFEGKLSPKLYCSIYKIEQDRTPYYLPRTALKKAEEKINELDMKLIERKHEIKELKRKIKNLENRKPKVEKQIIKKIIKQKAIKEKPIIKYKTIIKKEKPIVKVIEKPVIKRITKTKVVEKPIKIIVEKVIEKPIIKIVEKPMEIDQEDVI